MPVHYVDGVWTEEPSLSLDDLGILRGYGVFDYLCTYRGQPFELRAHLERLERSASQIYLELPHSLDEMDDLVREALARNSDCLKPEATIRLVVTGGPSPNHLTPKAGASRLSIQVQAFQPTTSSPPVAVITTSIPRAFPTVKSLNYLTAIVALHGTVDKAEAIYLDGQRRLTEGTRSNLLCVMGKTIVTANEDVLHGITTAVVLRLIQEHTDYTVEHRSLSYDEIPSLEEAFLTSTTKEILPIRQIDDCVLPTAPGPVTQHLQSLFRSFTDSYDN